MWKLNGNTPYKCKEIAAVLQRSTHGVIVHIRTNSALTENSYKQLNTVCQAQTPK